MILRLHSHHKKGGPYQPSQPHEGSRTRARSIVILSQGEDADEADAGGAVYPGVDGRDAVPGWARGGRIEGHRQRTSGADGDLGQLSRAREKKKVLPLIGNDMTGRSAADPLFFQKIWRATPPSGF